MKTAVKLGLLAVLMLGSMGCVAQREVDQWRDAYRRSEEQQVDLKARLEEAESRIRALQEMQRPGAPDLSEQLAQAIADRDRLAQALEEARTRLANMGQIDTDIALPEEMDVALRQLAEEHPELMDYDPALGRVRFRSDLTFAPGSTEISPDATTTLRRLAEILQRPIARPYEARVVGHTDTLRISRPETLRQHPTNYHLSAHRSIAVKDVLQRAGVDPVRIAVVGHGEYRPAVPNGPRGAEANRRVEIFIAPNTYTGPGVQAGGSAQPMGRAVETRRAAPEDEAPPEAFK